MNPSEFFLPMIPPKVTNQMHRIVADPRGHRPRFYDPSELAEARAKFLSHLSVHAPAEKLSGPVRLLVIWCVSRPKESTGTGNSKPRSRIPIISRSSSGTA